MGVTLRGAIISHTEGAIMGVTLGSAILSITLRVL